MKTLFVLASVVVLFLAAPKEIEAQKRSATNVLDESRARVLIGQAPQMQRVQIPWDRIAPVIERSTNANRGTTLSRLIEANLVSQTVSVLTYPRISGTFASLRYPQDSNLPNVVQSLTLQLQMVDNVITGTCKYLWGYGAKYSEKDFRWYNDGYAPQPVSGTVTSNGFVQFTNDCAVGGAQHFQFTQDGTTAVLRSTENRDMGPGRQDSSWDLTGTPSGTIEVKWYVYTVTPKVQITSSDQRVLVEGGRYLIGDVSELRLVTETLASAKFAWQAQLNLLGNILLDGARPSGKGAAVFAKKPNGTWMLLRLE